MKPKVALLFAQPTAAGIAVLAQAIRDLREDHNLFWTCEMPGTTPDRFWTGIVAPLVAGTTPRAPLWRWSESGSQQVDWPENPPWETVHILGIPVDTRAATREASEAKKRDCLDLLCRIPNQYQVFHKYWQVPVTFRPPRHVQSLWVSRMQDYRIGRGNPRDLRLTDLAEVVNRTPGSWPELSSSGPELEEVAWHLLFGCRQKELLPELVDGMVKNDLGGIPRLEPVRAFLDWRPPALQVGRVLFVTLLQSDATLPQEIRNLPQAYSEMVLEHAFRTWKPANGNAPLWGVASIAHGVETTPAWTLLVCGDWKADLDGASIQEALPGEFSIVTSERHAKQTDLDITPHLLRLRRTLAALSGLDARHLDRASDRPIRCQGLTPAEIEGLIRSEPSLQGALVQDSQGGEATEARLVFVRGQGDSSFKGNELSIADSKSLSGPCTRLLQTMLSPSDESDALRSMVRSWKRLRKVLHDARPRWTVDGQTEAQEALRRYGLETGRQLHPELKHFEVVPPSPTGQVPALEDWISMGNLHQALLAAAKSVEQDQSERLEGLLLHAFTGRILWNLAARCLDAERLGWHALAGGPEMGTKDTVAAFPPKLLKQALLTWVGNTRGHAGCSDTLRSLRIGMRRDQDRLFLSYRDFGTVPIEDSATLMTGTGTRDLLESVRQFDGVLIARTPDFEVNLTSSWPPSPPGLRHGIRFIGPLAERVKSRLQNRVMEEVPRDEDIAVVDASVPQAESKGLRVTVSTSNFDKVLQDLNSVRGLHWELGFPVCGSR